MLTFGERKWWTNTHSSGYFSVTTYNILVWTIDITYIKSPCLKCSVARGQKKLIIIFSCVLYAPLTWAENFVKIVHLIHK